jgi:serine/threonine-protein kinase RsbW
MTTFRVETEFGDRELAGPVMGRIVGILATRVGLPIDRLSDALLVSDAVVAATRGERAIAVEAALEPKRLALFIGPFADGESERIVAAIEAPIGAGALARLVDDLRHEQAAGGDYLVLGLTPA